MQRASTSFAWARMVNWRDLRYFRWFPYKIGTRKVAVVSIRERKGRSTITRMIFAVFLSLRSMQSIMRVLWGTVCCFVVRNERMHGSRSQIRICMPCQAFMGNVVEQLAKKKLKTIFQTFNRKERLRILWLSYCWKNRVCQSLGMLHTIQAVCQAEQMVVQESVFSVIDFASKKVFIWKKTCYSSTGEKSNGGRLL